MTSRRSVRTIVVLLAGSGGATLTGEALGLRVLRPMVGSTALATTGTLVGVLGALGLGAWYAGHLIATGRRTPRGLFVTVHGALALYALLGAWCAPWLATPVARVLVPLSEYAPIAGGVARVVLAFTLTALPGALAGASYPAAVSLLARGAGEGTALVGAASSLGAAVAVLAATFVLAPWLGLAHTLTLTAVVYLAVAVVSARTFREDSAPPPVAPSPATTPRRVVAAIALFGVASTAWQVLMARAGALAFGPSAFSFAASLAAHVTALALGELIAFRVAPAGVDDARRWLARASFAAPVAALVATPLVTELPTFAAHLLAQGAPSLPVLWLTAYGALTVAALPVVGCVGAAMAFTARVFAGNVTSKRSDSDANGRTLAATAMGNVLGALLASFVAMPTWGIAGAALTVACVLAAATWFARSRMAAVVALGVVVLAALRTMRVHDADEMLRGAFLYGGGSDVELGTVVWRRDGPEGTVAVRRDETGNVLLQINGKVDATSLGDASTQTLVGALPVAFARAPRDVLVVGLGSGMTVDAARAVPGVEHVVVAELLRDVVRAARHDFARANHRCLEDHRVSVIEVDAAQYLRGAPRRFDAIVSEPSNPWVAGMSELFTRESFEAARARLTPGGTFGQWFHAYGTSADVVASIVATFRAVFPASVLVEVSPGVDYMLIGWREPASVDVDVFLRRVSDPTMTRMLEAAGVATHEALMARVLSGTRGLDAVARDATLLRASDLRLEFMAPSLLYRDATAEVLSLLARIDDLPLAGLVRDTSAQSTWLRLLDASDGVREAATHTRAMTLAERRNDLSRALREGEIAVGLSAHDGALRARLARLYLTRAALRMRRDPGAAEEDLTAVLELSPPTVERFRALLALGDLAMRRRDGQRALARYQAALAIADAAREPAPEVHVRLAAALSVLGAREQANEALTRAAREAPSTRRRREIEALRR